MATLYQRNRVWWIQYYIDGKRYLESLHTSNEREAKILKKEREAKLRLRMISPHAPKVKIVDAIKEYILFKKPTIKPSTAKRYDLTASHLEAYFVGPRKVYLHELKNDDIARYVSMRQSDGASGKTITEELLILKATIQYAIQQKVLSSSPIRAWPRIRKTTSKPETIDRYSPEEIAQIKEYFKSHEDYDYFLGLIYTGCRRGELWEISRGDVDLQGGTLRLQNLKTGTNTTNQFRTIQIHTELKDVLERRCMGKKPSEKIFPIKGTGIWLIHAFRKACTKMEIPYRRLHGLRHAFISALLNAGVAPLQVMAMVGHNNLSTTMKYSHVSKNDLMGKIERLGY